MYCRKQAPLAGLSEKHPYPGYGWTGPKIAFNCYSQTPIQIFSAKPKCFISPTPRPPCFSVSARPTYCSKYIRGALLEPVSCCENGCLAVFSLWLEGVKLVKYPAPMAGMRRRVVLVRESFVATGLQ